MNSAREAMGRRWPTEILFSGFLRHCRKAVPWASREGSILSRFFQTKVLAMPLIRHLKFGLGLLGELQIALFEACQVVSFFATTSPATRKVKKIAKKM